MVDFSGAGTKPVWRRQARGHYWLTGPAVYLSAESLKLVSWFMYMCLALFMLMIEGSCTIALQRIKLLNLRVGHVLG